MRDITPPHLACTVGFSCTRVIEDGDDLIVIAKRVHPSLVPQFYVASDEEAVRISKDYFPGLTIGTVQPKDHLEAFRK